MSNPAVHLLSTIEIQNKTLRIEDNLGEAIHLHIGELRVSLTVKEFNGFYEAILLAAKQLFELRGLCWDVLDITALDWDWLGEYANIEKVCFEIAELQTLYTVRYFLDNKNLPLVSRVNKSNIYLFLENNIVDIMAHNIEEPNKDTDRLESVIRQILEKGYPYDEKYIMVDQNGCIYDGDHRAAILYYLRGGKYKVRVLKIIKKKNEVVSIVKLRQKIKIFIWSLRQGCHLAIRVFHDMIGRVAAINKTIKRDGYNNKLLTVSEFTDKLNYLDIDYYMIDQKTYSIEGKVQAIATFIIKEGELAKVGGQITEGRHYMVDLEVDFLYSISEPLYYTLFEGIVLVFDKICCRSKFQNAILPVDKYILQYGWNTLKVNESGIKEASKSINIIYILLDVFLGKGFFAEDERNYIEKNILSLVSQEFMQLLQREFFNYTPRLIELLKQKQYEEAIHEYRVNINY